MVASAVQVASKRVLLATMRAVALTVGMALTFSRHSPDGPDREVVVDLRGWPYACTPTVQEAAPSPKSEARSLKAEV